MRKKARGATKSLVGRDIGFNDVDALGDIFLLEDVATSFLPTP